MKCLWSSRPAVRVLERSTRELSPFRLENTFEHVCGRVGAPETELSLRLREYAATVEGRVQLAIEALAASMEIIPRAFAENAGLDAITMLVDMRADHEAGKKNFGIDVDAGKPADMLKAGVVEPLRVKTQAISSAAEAAVMILRIDDIIASSKAAGADAGMPPGGMGGY